MITSFTDYLAENEILLEKLMIFGKSAYPKFNNVVILAGGAGCFDGDTLVKTDNGYIKISAISPGDKVWTFDEVTGEQTLQVVDERFEYNNHSDNIVELTTDTGEKIICTETHEFFIDGEWIMAKDLPLEC